MFIVTMNLFKTNKYKINNGQLLKLELTKYDFLNSVTRSVVVSLATTITMTNFRGMSMTKRLRKLRQDNPEREELGFQKLKNAINLLGTIASKLKNAEVIRYVNPILLDRFRSNPNQLESILVKHLTEIAINTNEHAEHEAILDTFIASYREVCPPIPRVMVSSPYKKFSI